MTQKPPLQLQDVVAHGEADVRRWLTAHAAIHAADLLAQFQRAIAVVGERCNPETADTMQRVLVKIVGMLFLHPHQTEVALWR